MRTKPIKMTCEKCGEIEMQPLFMNDDGAVWIVAKTLQQAGKIYKSIMGATYERDIGNKMSDDFEYGALEKCSHVDLDEPVDGHYITGIYGFTNSHTI